MGQAIQVRKKFAGVGGDVRNVWRDVEEISRTHVDPRLQLLTEPQHRPSLQDVDGGLMSGVAMGLCSPAGRDLKKVGTQCSRSRPLGRDALELGQPLPRGAGRSCGKHDHRSHMTLSSEAKTDRPCRLLPALTVRLNAFEPRTRMTPA